jgi:glycosyltransferase involved in cell wall biosynthesis
MGYLPSRFSGESFPLTIIDCLHSGKPVLASDVGEIPSMLEADGKLAGCLFSLEKWKIPVRDVAEIIARCATDRNYYDEIKKMAPVAAEKFNPMVMRDKYDAIYTGLTHAKKDGSK